jgi:hypothetical protein
VPIAYEYRPQNELFEAKLEVRKKRTDEQIARKKALEDADRENEKAFYTALLEVAKGSIDRARASADVVQKAAAAIVTLYVGILGVAFAVAENPLPLRGVYPAIYLGLAIALSTVFLAFLPDASEEETVEASGVGEEDVRGLALANLFIRWTRAQALVRSRWLRASVIALAVGVAFLPAPFITAGSTSVESTEAEWPDPTSVFPSSHIELRKIVYTAQVDAFAQEVKAAKPVVKANDWAWFVLFMIGLAFVVGVLLFSTRFWGWVGGVVVPALMIIVPIAVLWPTDRL